MILPMVVWVWMKLEFEFGFIKINKETNLRSKAKE